MGEEHPVSVSARSSDKALSSNGTKDATFGGITMDDGAIWSMNISWALPVVWPGPVYGLEIGIVGTRGVIDIEDTRGTYFVIPDSIAGAAIFQYYVATV